MYYLTRKMRFFQMWRRSKTLGFKGQLSWLIWATPSLSHKSLKGGMPFLDVMKDVMMEEGSRIQEIWNYGFEDRRRVLWAEKCRHPQELRKYKEIDSLVEGSESVLVCLGCFNKILINERNVFLTVLESESLRSGHQHGWVRSQTSFITSHGRRA